MNIYIAGVDEAGRGPLFGPVYAAAVILDPNKPIPNLADSKKLTEKKRNVLFDEIKQKALAYSIQSASVAEIDSLNILQASLLAMRRAILDLSIKPTSALIDGNQTPKRLPGNIYVEAIVKGDSKHACISAASILAKVARDQYITELAYLYPEYGLDRHKGYPTKAHMEALIKLGPIKGMHRESFRPVQIAMQEFSCI